MPSLASVFYRTVMRLTMGRFFRSEEDIAEKRARIERFTRLAPLPKGVTILPADAGGVPSEWSIPAAAPADQVILYIHGGAWIICTPATHRGMVAQLCRYAGMRSLSIDYRLAPEHPFPAALDDCLDAYRWLLAQGFAPHKIALAGDSAGGNLVLATLLALRNAGDPLPAAAVCLSPATDLTGYESRRSTRLQTDLVLKPFAEGPDVTEQYTAGHDRADPLVSPLYGDLHGLPPILIHVGEAEVLLDDSVRFVEKACAAGVDASLVVWPSMWHVFQMHAPSMPEARQSLEQIGEFLRQKVG